MRALLLLVGEQAYAVDMAVAREVVALPAITGLPGAPPAVVGVFNLRGEIVPVFDTARLLGAGAAGDSTHVVVVDTAAGLAALTMSAMGESVELGDAVGTTDSPGTVAAHEVGSHTGSLHTNVRLAALIDVDALLAPERVGR